MLKRIEMPCFDYSVYFCSVYMKEFKAMDDLHGVKYKGK